MDMTNKILLRGALGLRVPTEFSAQEYDYEAALRDEVRALAGTYKLYRRNKAELFDLLSEAADEIIPNRVIESLGMFADVQQVANGNRVTFRVKKGRNRAKQFVTRSTPSGVYETFRLDSDVIDLMPVIFGGAGVVDFERYMDGSEDIMDVYDILAEGLIDRIYEMVQNALIASWNNTGRPSANKVSANTFDPAQMQALCNTVAAYGSPVIYCAPQFAATMSNFIDFYSDEDRADIRERGYIGKFRGTPVVVMPQSFEDDNNTKLTFAPRFAYVLPAGKEKVVKIVMEGDTIIDEWKNADRSIEVQCYKKLAVGVVNTPNYWGIYYNSGIADGGWEYDIA